MYEKVVLELLEKLLEFEEE